MEGSIGQRILAVSETPKEVLVLGRWPGWLSLLRWLFMLGLAAAVVFGGMRLRSYLVATAEKPKARPAVERTFPVETVIARRETVTPTILSYGEVTPARTVDLRSLAAGEVIAISPNLVEGGMVRRDETLLRVDTFNAEAALIRARSEKVEAEARQAETAARITSEQEALNRAEEQLALAERDVERITALRRSGSASNAQLDAAQLRASSSNQAVEQRRNAILVLQAQAQREAAPLERLAFAIKTAERDIANSTLQAPFSGTISNAGAEIGKLLSQNDRVATLVGQDEIDVRFSLGDAQFGRLAKNGEPLLGKRITAVWRSGGSEFRRGGVITRVAPLASAREAGFNVFARLDAEPKAAPIWRQGAFVEIQLQDRAYTNVLKLPQSAVFPGGIVYLVGKDDRLVEVRITEQGFDAAFMLADGALPDGSEIVATRLSEAGPGILVVPKNRIKDKPIAVDAPAQGARKP